MEGELWHNDPPKRRLTVQKILMGQSQKRWQIRVVIKATRGCFQSSRGKILLLSGEREVYSCDNKEEEMRVQRVFIGLLTVFLVISGLSAVSYARFAADFGNEPGKVTAANEHNLNFFAFVADFGNPKSYGLVVSYDPGANLVFRVKSDFCGESHLGFGEIFVIGGAQRMNTLRDIAPLSLMITPDKSELVQDYPNPFNRNPETTIRHLPNELSTTQQRAGRYIVNWNGQDENGRSVASGIYFYRGAAGDFQSVKRMLMLK